MMKKVSQVGMESVSKPRQPEGEIDVSKARGEGGRQKIMIKMQRTHLRIKHLCL